MIKCVILDNERAAAKAREIVSRHGINLGDIVFVGAEPDENTITTLPSTFPKGDFRYKVCTVTQREKAQGKRLIEIVKAHNFPYKSAEGYFGSRNSCGRNANAVNSVLRASEKGILPFGYTNEHINQLNILFSLAFWTGCASYGLVQIVPNEYNQTALDECLKKLGYGKLDENSRRSGYRKKDEEAVYSIQGSTYYILDSALSRTFALLGLPYREGKKTSKIDLDIPWYADFMYSQFDNQSKKKSQEEVENFRRIFMYSLLSNKTKNISSRASVGVDIMATCQIRTGRKLTKKVAQQLMMTFPGVEIIEEDLTTTRIYKMRKYRRRKEFGRGERRKLTYANWIRLYRDNMQLIIEALVDGDFKSEKPPHLEIRRLAGNALCTF